MELRVDRYPLPPANTSSVVAAKIENANNTKKASAVALLILGAAAGLIIAGIQFSFTAVPLIMGALVGVGMAALIRIVLIAKRAGKLTERPDGETPNHQALFDQLQKKEIDYSSLSSLNENDARALLKLATTPDEQGQYPIAQWRSRDSSQLLRFKLTIPVEAQMQLFLTYYREEKFSIPTLLDEYPEAIGAVRSLTTNPLFDEGISTNCLGALIRAMKIKEIAFTSEESWLVQAVDGETQIKDHRGFTSLRITEREKILSTLRYHRFQSFAELLETIDSKCKNALYELYQSQHHSFSIMPSDQLVEEWLYNSLTLNPATGEYPATGWRMEDLFMIDSYLFIPLEVQQAIFAKKLESSLTESTLGDLLARWPEAIFGIRRVSNFTLFEKTISEWSKECVKRLVAEMRQHGVEFLPEELWVVRAVDDDSTSFDDPVFTTLSMETQQKIYLIANKLHARNLVVRFNDLGMRRSFDHPLPLVPMLDPQMDLVGIEQTMTSYLQSLRREGRLLTRNEFERKGGTENYLPKKRYLDRILGTDRLRNVAAQQGCRAVFVPEKIVVIDDGCTQLTLKTKLDGRGFPSEFLGPPLSWEGHYPMQIYAQGVQAEYDRKMKVWQVIDLAKVLWHSGYTDFKNTNIFKSESGFWFVDNEFISFSFRWSDQTAKEEIRNYVLNLVETGDREELLSELDGVFQTPRETSIRDHARFVESLDQTPLINTIESITISIAQIIQADPSPSSSALSH